MLSTREQQSYRSEGGAINAPSKPSRKLLAQMVLGNQVQQAIYVAAKLGIADLLNDGPKTSDELAQSTGADPTALSRLLRALASFGLFAQDEQRRFELTPLASLLETGPNSVRPFALWSGGVSYQAFGGLEYSVRTGKPAFENIFGMEFFEYLSKNQDAGDLFAELMSLHTAPIAPAVAAYDFSGVETVVEIGGGRGELLAAILSAHPHIRGVLVDSPQVVRSAETVLTAAGVAERCELLGQDIFKGVPGGGDCYLLKSVIHGLSDEQAAGLLSSCRRVMHETGKLLLVEFVIPEGNEPFAGKLMDLLMLVGCYGRERSREEFELLLTASGFRLSKVIETKHGYSLIEGEAN
jgi:ubiquinone/menaquinone biosynthesis C-methylase UbiE